MIASYVIDSSRKHELPYLAQVFLNEDPAAEITDGFTESQYRTCERADFAFQLVPMFRRKIEEDDLTKIYSEMEMPLIPILYEIEMAGMKVDVYALKGFSQFITTELATLKDKIYAIAGREFNIGSPKQVGEILQELNIETGKRPRRARFQRAKIFSPNSHSRTTLPNTLLTIASSTN